MHAQYSTQIKLNLKFSFCAIASFFLLWILLGVYNEHLRVPHSKHSPSVIILSLPICWEILIWSNLSSRIWFKSLSQNPETSLRQSASSAHLSGWGILARRIRRKEKLDIKCHIWVDQSKILGLPDSKSKKSRQRNTFSKLSLPGLAGKAGENWFWHT